MLRGKTSLYGYLPQYTDTYKLKEMDRKVFEMKGLDLPALIKVRQFKHIYHHNFENVTVNPRS